MVMDDIMMRFFGGMFGGAIDWAAVLLFVAVAVLYFLAPVLGYRPERRGGLVGALYVLTAYGGVSVLQVLMQYLQILERPGRGFEETTMHAMFIFAIAKMLAFVVAMLLFAVGLQALRFVPEDDEED